MAFRPILATRKLIPISLTSGSFVELTAFDGAWPFMGVDYANLGSEIDPPSLAYVNIVDNTLGGQIGVLLPISAEGVEIVSQQRGYLKYRHPRWAKG